MKTRLITAGVAIIVFLAVLIFGEMNSIVITIAIALANTIMCGEYLSAKKLNKNLKLMIPCLLAALLIPLLSYTDFRYIPYYAFTLALVISILMISFNLFGNGLRDAFDPTQRGME